MSTKHYVTHFDTQKNKHDFLYISFSLQLIERLRYYSLVFDFL